MLPTLMPKSTGRTAWPPVAQTPKHPIVMLITGGYQVDLGPRQAPRFHLVLKDRTCNCGAAECRGVRAVKDYLKAGGAPAPDGSALKPITLIERCPICAGQTHVVEGRWECLNHHAHYFEYRVTRLRAARERWLASLAPALADYHAEVSTAFVSPEVRAAFVQAHRPTYTVDA
ncbi:MAG TPA: hypothetical protein VLG46_00060 [Anaerolineae bacterium]|nr:hypothetical protein [Anaerolineae bacterium]